MTICFMSTCIEKKILLSGEIHRYPCELISYEGAFGVLRYVLDRNYTVGNIVLKPGDVTYAFYWTDRPYTLYTWLLNDRKSRLFYFNIADQVSLSPWQFVWRDLAVDILIDGKTGVRILDEEELPLDLPPDLLRSIETTKRRLLVHYNDITAEAEALLRTHLRGSEVQRCSEADRRC